MALEDVRRSWETLARSDPLWAILTDPARKGGRWDLDEFLASGRVEIERVMARAAELGRPARRERALDFGCGVGRLTQALCAHFERCDGVDIASGMVEQARRLNAFGDRCAYHQNTVPDLRLFPDGTFDFAYSNIVLQHVPPAAARAYLAELVRVLRPGGLLVFQIPARMRLPRALWRPLERSVARVIARIRAEPIMEMYGLRRRPVERVIRAAGGMMLAFEPDDSAGHAWISYRYWVSRGC
ncbi:class I SAM-dependent methyltransferase [Anaeromyxobacter sp. PSR-1]|uniref:class I SAM-dependent methyltransferase n=1 Tax=Anaeromyxobacter sp. PSR-1 TaxID=1300915 RepID=UPI0005E451E7|nr:class I SAM-dependent methyltransferase [Anaeromyxobacter sp. PSR-1]GAO02284.1 putative 37.1 kDa protein in transposon [Anaeromyxobacter sp. PSR-1]